MSRNQGICSGNHLKQPPQPKRGIVMKNTGLIAFILLISLLSATRLNAQQLNSSQHEVWQAVEGRWQAWQAGNLEKMITLYHPRFHAWNRVSGRLDGHQALLDRWKTALKSESILDVKLDPIAIEVYGKFASVFYISHETVKQIAATSDQQTGSAQTIEPSIITIRWSDYLVKENGRWLFVGYNGVPCPQPDTAGQVCGSSTGK
jgi:hypothetical protein